jgi:hypothetical protein
VVVLFTTGLKGGLQWNQQSVVKIVFAAGLVDDLISENCGGYHHRIILQVRGENNFLLGVGKIPDIQSLNYPNLSPKYPIIVLDSNYKNLNLEHLQ